MDGSSLDGRKMCSNKEDDGCMMLKNTSRLRSYTSLKKEFKNFSVNKYMQLFHRILSRFSHVSCCC